MKKIWGIGAVFIFIFGVMMVLFFQQHNKENKWNESVEGNLPVIGTKSNLNNYFKKILKETNRTRTFWGAEENSLESKASDSVQADDGGKQQASETNVQVKGVDEADIVKTDGNHIFQVSQNRVKVIKAIPPGEMKLVATLNYDDSFLPNELYFYQNQLVVIGQSHDFRTYITPTERSAVQDMKIAPVSQATKAVVYNVENPEKPAQIREIKLDGAYISSRRMDGIVYLVTNQYPEYWLLEENDAIDLRPTFSDSVKSTSAQPIDYDKIQYFPDSKEANYIMIASFDLEKPEKEANVTTYLGSGNQLYMSKENLYLAVPHYEEKAFDLSNSANTPDSNIYKFSVKDTEVKFHSSAVVSGTLLNQFSMDEYNGYFRLVTTKGYAWDERQPSTNQLIILDGNLKQVGKLSDLARGERIYLARFLGDKIYMVTFKETDPLFVIDAKEPMKPKVLGELKIPGFSHYLHPYDEHHLIGFGQNTKIVNDKAFNDQPRVITEGVKISLFDVSDLRNPKEKFTEIIGGRGTYSPLNHDHKALLFNKEKELFAFPLSVYQNSTRNEYEQIYEFQGAYVYKINLETGFNLLSKISHETEKAQFEQYENTIERLVTIGDTIYALSPDKISAHDLTSNALIGELSLK